ncbi:MAG: cysteine desulfurase family protein [Bacilli bacterium]|nr:cysteine desulfurase family protein [Bacilli bacterium]
MIYLDYSATTPVNKEVLASFDKASLDFFANPNSLHYLGVKTKQLIEAATKQIADILAVKEDEIIYTSGSSESNNLAIKGVADRYKGKHIITTMLEHSSIYGPLSYLQKKGYEITFLKLKNGLVDLDDLKNSLREDTVLVTIASVNSETGVLQNIEEISKVIKENSKAIFHVDMTQSVGKVNVSMKNVDLASFSAHKFYGLKGIGCLIKKEDIKLEPIIHGGKSTTVYRSGTPATSLIVSLSKALKLINQNITKNYDYISSLYSYLADKLKAYDGVYINSINNIPHILNISLNGIKPETFQHALEEHDILISTQSACSTGEVSKAVMAVTNDEEKARTSVRISLSYLTTKDEIEKFLKAFDVCYKNLR